MTEQIDTRALIGQLRYEAEGDDALSILCGCAADQIERLTRELAEAHDMLDNRNEFIAQKGLWKELGKYLSEPHADEQSGDDLDPKKIAAIQQEADKILSQQEWTQIDPPEQRESGPPLGCKIGYVRDSRGYCGLCGAPASEECRGRS